MSLIDKDPVTSKFTRGEITEPPMAQIALAHTRGPFQPADTRVPTSRSANLMLLSDLLQTLRVQVGALPLVIVVHGWGLPPAEEFLTLLCPLLAELDAVWLVPSGAKLLPAHADKPADAFLLDLTLDSHLTTYQHLIGDIVFFPANEDDELAQVSQFRRRARSLIVNNQGAKANSLLSLASRADAVTYSWVSNLILKEFVEMETAGESALVEIGGVLSAAARQIDGRNNRRPLFRSMIEKTLATYPKRPYWLPGLVREAHKNGWADWAVACLPPYIPEANNQACFVWEFFVPVLEEYGRPFNIEDRLCRGQFILVTLSTDAANLVRHLAPIIEEKVDSITLPSYRAIIGAVTDLLSDIQMDFDDETEGNCADIQSAVEEAHKEILREKQFSLAVGGGQ